MEIWKDITGYEGLYQISNYGRVKSLSRMVKGWRGTYQIKEKILKPSFDKDNYRKINFSKDGVPRTFKVQRLVALHFIPNEEGKPEVNHIVGTDKCNNHVSNLVWCTSKENIDHAFSTGLNHRGSNHYRTTLSEDDVRYIRQTYVANCNINGGAALGKKFGVSRETIYKIVKKVNWKHLC